MDPADKKTLIELKSESLLDGRPFMFHFREFVPFNAAEDAALAGPTERSTGTAGREDEYDAP